METAGNMLWEVGMDLLCATGFCLAVVTNLIKSCVTNRCMGIYKFGNKYLPSAYKTQLEFRSLFRGGSASYRLGNTVLVVVCEFLLWWRTDVG
jgi:hypothetical protein